MNGVLLDENLPAALAHALRNQEPDLAVRRVGHGMAPVLGSADQAILVWIDEQDFILATDNRESMPVHLAAHLSAGQHVPGILQVPKQYSYEALASDIVLTVGASLPGELADRITYLVL